MKKKKIQRWEYGQKTLLAEKTGILRSYISDIFNRRVGCGKATALKILKAADEMALALTLEDLILNETTDHPLFTTKDTAIRKYGKTENTETPPGDR